MNESLELLIPIFAITCTIGLPVILGMNYAVKTANQKHIERMELIKQGLIPPNEYKETPNQFKSLKNAIILIGLGLGLVIGLFIVKSMNLGENDAFWVVAPSILIFLGASYLLYFFISKKYHKTE